MNIWPQAKTHNTRLLSSVAWVSAKPYIYIYMYGACPAHTEQKRLKNITYAYIYIYIYIYICGAYPGAYQTKSIWFNLSPTSTVLSWNLMKT